MSDADDLRDATELRQMTCKILWSRPCQQIYFKNVVCITGILYGYVADMINRGVIKVEVGDVGRTALAAYHWSSEPKKLIFRRGALSRINAGSIWNMASIVHEATHAVIDVTGKGRWLYWQYDEVSCALAEVIYLLNADWPWRMVVDHYGTLLYDLAKKIRAFRGPNIYECTLGDIDQLKRNISFGYIQNRPELRDWDGYKSTGISWPDRAFK